MTTMTAMETIIKEIAENQSTSQSTKIQQLQHLILDNKSHVTGIIEYIVNSTKLGSIITRPVINWVLRDDEDGLVPGQDQREGMLLGLIEVISPHLVSYEEQDAQIRFQLADLYESHSLNYKAANILKPIKLDSAQRSISDVLKLQTWIRIVRNLLQCDDTVGAQVYLNRASLLLPKIQQQQQQQQQAGDNDTKVLEELQIHFKLSQARILDSQCKFLEASNKYYQLSTSPLVDPHDCDLCLSAAIICAVLAPAGPDKSRILASLYRDVVESSSSTKTPHQLFSILENMYLDRLIPMDEKEKFALNLSPHHLAVVENDLTVLDRAVIQHNLLAASKLYLNISLLDLQSLLGIPNNSNVEKMAAQILSFAHLNAKIDQVNQFIYFDPENRKSGLVKNNANLQNICLQIQQLSQQIASLHPELL